MTLIDFDYMMLILHDCLYEVRMYDDLVSLDSILYRLFK